MNGHVSTSSKISTSPRPVGSQTPPNAQPVEEAVNFTVEEQSINLVEEKTANGNGVANGGSQFKSFGGASGGIARRPQSQYKRQVTVTGKGAMRCRLFHCRMAPTPLEFLERQINEWLDDNEIEAKNVTQTIGMMEGKTSEPHLIMSVWY